MWIKSKWQLDLGTVGSGGVRLIASGDWVTDDIDISVSPAVQVAMPLRSTTAKPLRALDVRNSLPIDRRVTCATDNAARKLLWDHLALIP